MSVALVSASAQDAHVTVVVRPDLQSGRLIRATVVESKAMVAKPVSVHDPVVAAPVPVSSNLIEMIDQIAQQYDVEPPLVHSVIRAESNYNPNAISDKGALGMMQLIPSTARRFGVRNVFDPRQNVEGGVRYLRFLLTYFKGDYPKAIAAYNAGENAVDRYQGIPPYSETRNYVYQVAKNLKAARQAQDAKLAKATPPPAPGANAAGKTEVTYNPIRASVSEDGVVSYRTQ
jgi:soluble lytic murein transglycosylase-like protein